MLGPERAGLLRAAADAAAVGAMVSDRLDGGSAFAGGAKGSGWGRAEGCTVRCFNPENRSAGKGIEPELQAHQTGDMAGRFSNHDIMHQHVTSEILCWYP